MSKLTKNQKAFLKTIKNDKARAEQKTQFKLQNKFDIEFSDIIISGVGWGDRKEPQTITKEALRDLTEPKTKPVSTENVLKGFIEHCESRLNHNISLIECRDLKNSSIKQNQWKLGAGFRDKELKMLIEISREVLLDMVKCGEIDATTLFKVESEKLKLDLERKKEIDLLFPKPEGERIDLEKLLETAQIEKQNKTVINDVLIDKTLMGFRDNYKLIQEIDNYTFRKNYFTGYYAIKPKNKVEICYNEFILKHNKLLTIEIRRLMDIKTDNVGEAIQYKAHIENLEKMFIPLETDRSGQYSILPDNNIAIHKSGNFSTISDDLRKLHSLYHYDLYAKECDNHIAELKQKAYLFLINNTSVVETVQVEQPKVSQKNIRSASDIQLQKNITDWTKNAENTDASKEFCVGITKENKEVLSKVWGDFFNTIQNCTVGSFLHTNSLFRYCTQSNTKYPIRNYTRLVFAKVVSTEEFLTYIGREDLIEKPKTKVYDGFALDPLFSISDEAGHWQASKVDYNKLWNDVVPKKITDFPQTIIPKDNDCFLGTNFQDDIEFHKKALELSLKAYKDVVLKRDSVIAERNGVIQVPSNLAQTPLTHDESTKPTETVELKTYTKGDMKKCFWNSRNLLNDVRETIWVFPNFEQYLKSLK